MLAKRSSMTASTSALSGAAGSPMALKRERAEAAISRARSTVGS
jgi:hypothetical protein